MRQPGSRPLGPMKMLFPSPALAPGAVLGSVFEFCSRSTLMKFPNLPWKMVKHSRVLNEQIFHARALWAAAISGWLVVVAVHRAVPVASGAGSAIAGCELGRAVSSPGGIAAVARRRWSRRDTVAGAAGGCVFGPARA